MSPEDHGTMHIHGQDCTLYALSDTDVKYVYRTGDKITKTVHVQFKEGLSFQFKKGLPSAIENVVSSNYKETGRRLKERRGQLEEIPKPTDSRLEQSQTPPLGEIIISYVCTPDRLEAVLGDLQRNFTRIAAKHGEKAARRWYRWQMLRTVAAFGVQTLARGVMVHELLKRFGL